MQVNSKKASAQTHSSNNGTHRTHFTHLVTSPKAAFTLAEVLITLAIIGVVAAITIPSLVKNYNEKAWESGQKVFENRLLVATRQMNTEEKLAGYDSTMDFVNELKKYIKITRVCDNDNITKCFNKEVIWSADEEPVDMSKVTDASAFGLDWETDTVAVQFANGVNAVIAYNPNATQDPYNNQFAATSKSMAILYDLSGNKNPNTNGKDVKNINVDQLAGVEGCLIPELKDTMCITKIISPEEYGYLTYSECTEAKNNGEIDVDYCYNGYDDYFAGAVKACGGKKENLPNQAQLTQLAEYIYDGSSINSSGATDPTEKAMNTEKAAKFLSASPDSSSGWFYVWSGQEDSSYRAYSRYFYSTYTNRNYSYRTGSYVLAVCLDH